MRTQSYQELRKSRGFLVNKYLARHFERHLHSVLNVLVVSHRGPGVYEDSTIEHQVNRGGELVVAAAVCRQPLPRVNHDLTPPTRYW